MLSISTLTSVCIFFLLFSIHFLWYWQGEFIYQSQLLRLWSFPLFSWSKWMIHQYYCKEKLDAGHSRFKGLRVWFFLKNSLSLIKIRSPHRPQCTWKPFTPKRTKKINFSTVPNKKFENQKLENMFGWELWRYTSLSMSKVQNYPTVEIKIILLSIREFHKIQNAPKLKDVTTAKIFDNSLKR